jgi:hypothetical protein
MRFSLGFTFFIGVPLYTVTIGMCGSLAINSAMDQLQEKALYSPITEEEFLDVASFATESDKYHTALSKAEYILLELMRLGKVITTLKSI